MGVVVLTPVMLAFLPPEVSKTQTEEEIFTGLLQNQKVNSVNFFSVYNRVACSLP